MCGDFHAACAGPAVETQSPTARIGTLAWHGGAGNVQGEDTVKSMTKWLAIVACTALLTGCNSKSSSSSGPNSTDEKEPLDKTATGAVTNDTAGTAETLTVGTPMFGALADAADVDFYKFHGSAGKLLTVDSYVIRLDAATWTESLRLRLFDTDGETLLYTSGDDNIGWESEDYGMALIPVPADGDYYLAVDVLNPSATVGKYALRLALSSPPGSFQHEQEAPDQSTNDSIDTAEAIVPGLLAGYYADGNPDFYSFTLAQQTRVRFTVTAFRNGSNGGANETAEAFDTEIYLRDSDGNEITGNDDAWYLDSSVESVLAPGDYFLQMDKCCGTPNEPYLISFETPPLSLVTEAAGNDTKGTAMAIAYGTSVEGTFVADEPHYFKVSGKAGDLMRLYGLNTENMNEPILLDASDGSILYGFSSGGPAFLQTILQANGDFYAVLTGTPGSFAFRIERVVAAGYESGQDGTVAKAGSFTADGWAAGTIMVGDETDLYGFQADAKQLVTVALYSAESATDAAADGDWGSFLENPVLEILDAEGTVIAKTDYVNANATVPTSVVRPSSTMEVAFRAPAGGKYYVAVSTSNPDDAGTGAYYALQLRKNQ